MAENTENETPEIETPEAVEPEAVEAAEPEAEATPEVETPAEPEAEATPEVEAETPAEEPAAEAAPEPEAEAEPEAPADDAPADTPAEPVVVEHPKVVRKRVRAQHAQANPQRTIEERAAERKEIRRAKAVARTRRRHQEREKAKAARAENPGAPTPPREHGPGAPKLRQGIVVSDKADKTITVQIVSARLHLRYKKIVRRTNTLHTHDESNSAHVGDRGQVIESRPRRTTRRWILAEIRERAQ